jgi:hypothetical protein
MVSELVGSQSCSHVALVGSLRYHIMIELVSAKWVSHAGHRSEYIRLLRLCVLLHPEARRMASRRVSALPVCKGFVRDSPDNATCHRYSHPSEHDSTSLPANPPHSTRYRGGYAITPSLWCELRTGQVSRVELNLHPLNGA